MQQKEFLVIANIHRRKVLRVLDKTMHGLLSVKIISKDLYVLNNYNCLYTVLSKLSIFLLSATTNVAKLLFFTASQIKKKLHEKLFYGNSFMEFAWFSDRICFGIIRNICGI